MVRAKKISTNSTVAQNFKISKINGEPIYSKEGKLSIEIRTINAVSKFCNCSEKTVRRALKFNGIIKYIHGLFQGQIKPIS